MNKAERLAIARAMSATLDAFDRRDQSYGSTVSAAHVIAAGNISYKRALSFDVPSESEPGRVHIVSLYLKLKRDRWTHGTGGPFTGDWRNEIIGARCSCPNRAELGPATERAPCKHILACLTLARLDGYRLEEPKA